MWIWGTGRSGSTWLLRLLAHPLRLPADSPHTVEGPERADERGRVVPINESFLPSHLSPLMFGTGYDESLEPLTMARTFKLARRSGYSYSAEYEDVWAPEVRRMALVRFHRHAERMAARLPIDDPLIAIKEVGSPHAAPMVMSLFGRSRLIVLLRDGRDVVSSQTAAVAEGGFLTYRKRGAYRDEGERLAIVERHAANWVGDMTALQRASDAHDRDLRTTIRYEDLIADPIATLEGLLTWLGLPHSTEHLRAAVEANAFDAVPDEMKGEGRFFRRGAVGSFRDDLSARELRAAEETMAPKLAELGYS